MKILQWNSAKCLGGAEFRTLELVEYFLSVNYQVYIVCRKNTLFEQKVREKNLSYISFFNFVDEFLKVLFFVIKWRPHIIHVHTGRDYTVALVIGIITSTPVVIHRRLFSKISSLTSFLIKISQSKVIAISKVVKDVLIKENGLGNDKVEVIYNAIPKERLKVNLQNIERLKKIFSNGNRKIIISVGNLYPTKGFSDLIEVVKVLKEKINNFLVLIVGEGKERRKIEKLIKQYNLYDEVKLLGRREDVIDLLHIADCFVLLSYEEPFGVAFIEALACGVPVVGYNAGGVPEVVLDKEVGFLLPPHDIYSVAEKVYAILTDKELKQKLSFNAKRYFYEKFDFDKMVASIERLYKEILNYSSLRYIRRY